MPRLIACLLASLALAACGAPGAAPSRSVAAMAVAAPSLDPEQARDAINAYRARKGLAPLMLNARLAAAAREHSADLARHDAISHSGSDGSSPWQRVKKAGYMPRLAAENVAAGQATLSEVLHDWRKSPGHNANLLAPEATEMGIALVHDADTSYRTFWTLVLGTPR